MIINDLSAAKPKNPFGAPIAGLLDALRCWREREHPSCWLYYIAAVFWCIEITALCFLAVEREKTMKFMPIIFVAVYIDPRKSVRRWWWRLWRACQVIYQQPTMYYTAGSIAWRDCCRRIQNVFLFFFFSFFLFVCVRFIRVFSLSPSPSISQHFQGRRMQGGGDMWCSGDHRLETWWTDWFPAELLDVDRRLGPPVVEELWSSYNTRKRRSGDRKDRPPRPNVCV